MSNVFKWSLNHKALMSDVREVVESLGFEKSETKEGIYTKKISAGSYWREMKIRLRPEEAVCFLLKEEETTTEMYFDYLIKAGFLMGQLAGKMQLLPLKDAGCEVPEVSEEEEDDEDLQEGDG